MFVRNFLSMISYVQVPMFRDTIGKLLYRRGMALTNIGDDTGAISDLNEAYDLHPKDNV